MTADEKVLATAKIFVTSIAKIIAKKTQDYWLSTPGIPPVQTIPDYLLHYMGKMNQDYTHIQELKGHSHVDVGQEVCFRVTLFGSKGNSS